MVHRCIVLPLIFLATSANVVNGFRVGSEGNLGKAVEDLLNTVKTPPPPTGKDDAPPLRNEILKTEVPCMYEYWQRPDIHTLGNIGIGGALHAAMAPFATKIIDVKAYGGQDVRKMISEELRVRSMLDKGGARVCDLCCGVGISTRALGKAFHDAELVVGVDTSPEMISMAKAISGHEQGVRYALARHQEGLKNLFGEKHKAGFESLTVIDTHPNHRHIEATYRLANAENTDLPHEAFNLVTIMYAFHEVPFEARSRIIQEARRLLKVGGTLAVVDISPTYTPSKYMLAGEPFVIEYQQNIDKQLASASGFRFSRRKEVVPGHVNMWLLTAK